MTPKPYYQDDLVTIYHGDCLEIDAWLEADVLVTDPPYGTETEIGYGRTARKKTPSAHSDLRDATHGVKIANDSDTSFRDAALRAWMTKPVAIFGSPRRPDPPGDWEDRLVWFKRRPGMNGGAFRYTHESIFVRGATPVNRGTFSVFDIAPEPQNLHIHAKPVELLTRLLSVLPGVVADPFMGSGTTLVAAKSLGRKAIGIEIEERYCEVAAKRCAQDYLF